MASPRYPHLAQMLGAYFHQDCYMDGASDADILDDFRANKPAGYVAATAREIDAFLAAHGTGLTQALDSAFAPDIVIGDTDEEARRWLETAARHLRG